ncbi:MAG TPA: LCP family protein [Solirubrobacteraceae bacterium]|nr:LCP family protein [Solirubrobacteraceae bacterium]
MRFLMPKSRLGLVVRVFCAAVLVIGSSAAAVATAGLLQIQQIVQDINVVPGSIVKTKQVTLPAPGKPQTLLVIGSDHRANSPSFRTANTDTMLLVRLNAASSTINIMSIPRDLKVQVPGYGTEKINAAYSEGGYGLLIKTIKQNVFPHLQVNHIIDTNFDGFSRIVDAIGCVWADVDHRYFNQSQPYPSPDNYSSINIQPGYQKLCGNSQVSGALAFVRFRHTDSDIVREARQQDFLRWAKENFPLSKLLADKDKLLRIFARHTTLDQGLKTSSGIIELFDLILNSHGQTLKQIPFPAVLANVTPGAIDYVYKRSNQAVAAAWAMFMRPTTSAPSAPHSTTQSHTPTTSHSASSGSRHAKAGRPAGPGFDTAGLTADPANGQAQAKQLTPDMPVYYPRYILSGSQYCTATGYECLNQDEPLSAYAHSYPRQYQVTIPGGRRVHAYVMTIAINPVLGEYYTVQGIHWPDPPILRHPTATKMFHGRAFAIYVDNGGHATDVAWHADGNSYWISNTLTSTIPIKQMVAIAESTVPYGG